MPVVSRQADPVQNSRYRAGCHIFGKFYIFPVGIVLHSRSDIPRHAAPQPGVAGYGRTSAIDSEFPPDFERTCPVSDSNQMIFRTDRGHGYVFGREFPFRDRAVGR